MPGFRLTEAETRALVKFISDLKDDAAPPLPERLRFRGLIPAASIEVGRRLASREFLSCASCHVGGEPPEGSPEEWAPDLRLSADRLNPDWIVRWLRDPQRLAPGTKMPTYFSDESSGPEEILEGDEERQILALRDYILSLGATGGAPEGVPAPPSRH
jgi:mono/diheme cytochrome c family protein